MKQREAAARLPNAADYDFLYDEVADRLVDRLDDVLDKRFARVLEIGGRHGGTYAHLRARADVEQLTVVDSSPGMLARYANTVRRVEREQAAADDDDDDDAAAADDDDAAAAAATDVDGRRRAPIAVEYVQCDEEDLSSLPSDAYDLVLSSLALHWVNDLPGVFAQVHRVLRDDGAFLGCMFGGETLFELRSSLLLAERERDGGVSAHVSPFAGVGDVGNLLQRAHFSLPTVDLQSLVVHYSSPLVLMEELGRMGEGNANRARRASLPRDTLLAAAAAYSSLYVDDDAPDARVPATFQLLFFIGWKPHASQPSPKRRGSATHSFKTLGDDAGTL